MPDPGALQEIDAKIDALRDAGDWRGGTLARVRELIREADPGVVETVKWRKPSNPAGIPVWEHDGLICGGELYKDKVKLGDAPARRVPDSAVVAADQRWAQCMAGHGHQFENIRRMQLLVASGGDLPGEAPRRIESPQAVLAAADQCTAETDLQSVYEAARARGENEFVRRHRATLDRHRYRPQ